MEPKPKLRAEEAAVARERERLSREKAAAVQLSAQREAAAVSEVGRIERERAMLEEARSRLSEERSVIDAAKQSVDKWACAAPAVAKGHEAFPASTTVTGPLCYHSERCPAGPRAECDH